MKKLTRENCPSEECFLFLRRFQEPVIGEVTGFTPSSCFGSARWRVTIEDQAGAMLDLQLTPEEILGWA